MINDLPEHEDEWLGFRTFSSRLFTSYWTFKKRYKNVFYSFGHHHLGWTLEQYREDNFKNDFRRKNKFEFRTS